MERTLDDVYAMVETGLGKIKESIGILSGNLDELTKKVDSIATGRKEENMSRVEPPRRNDPRSSKASLENTLLKLKQASSDRKRIVVVAQSSASKFILDSTTQVEEMLVKGVKLLVNYIEIFDTVLDVTASSSYLSTLLNCDVSFQSLELDNQAVDFSCLITESRADFQKRPQRNWILSESPQHFRSFVIDTHETNFKAPIFKFADRVGSNCKATNTGKPGCTSLMAPMFLEVKDVFSSNGCSKSEEAVMMNHEYDVLNQAIVRVQMTAFQNELLRRIFCFASTGSRSWLVFCERSHKLSKGSHSGSLTLLTETYRIIPIASSHILPTWKSISRAAAHDKSYYVHPDASFLADILRRMNFDMAYSRIKIIGNSGMNGSIVYGVSPGHPFYSENRKNYVMRFASEASFAIKVHQEMNRGTNEVNVLRELKGCKFAAKYVIGIFTSSHTLDMLSDYVLQYEDFWTSRPQENVSDVASSSDSLQSLRKRTSGLRLFDSEDDQNVSKSAAELKFQLRDESERSKMFVNDLITEDARMDPKDIWWEFSTSKVVNQDTRTESEKQADMSKKATDAFDKNASENRSRTAILMFMACDRVPYSNESAILLNNQLMEMHEHNILHTDTRSTNVQPFAFDTDVNGNPVVREYIIDFDLSVICAQGSKSIEIDISDPGARRDLALKLLHLPTDSQVKKVEWQAFSDIRALASVIESLYTYDVKVAPKPSIFLFPDTDSIFSANSQEI